MAILPGGERRRVASLTFLASGWVLAASGCTGVGYRVANLPVQYSAPPVVNVEAIDLAGLAGPAESFDVIQRGDVLEVTMVTDFTKVTTTTTPVRVGDDGSVRVPLIGPVRVAGVTAEAAERLIAAEGQTRGVFRTPCVTVTMKDQRKNKVLVVGAVKKPGAYELPRGSSSLLSALVAAEGLGKEAGMEVEIRRGGAAGGPGGGPRLASYAPEEGGAESLAALPAFPSIVTVNLAEAATTNLRLVPGRASSYTLHDGDVVHVAKRTPKPVYVQGLVRKPGEFEYPLNQELRVLDALAMAGGVSNSVADEVLVLRQLPGQSEPVRIALGIQAAKGGRDNLRLAPGDTVMVEQNAATALVDIVQTFFRVGFSASFPMF